MAPNIYNFRKEADPAYVPLSSAVTTIDQGAMAKFDATAGTRGCRAVLAATDAVNFIGVSQEPYPITPNIDVVTGAGLPARARIKYIGEHFFGTTAGDSYQIYDQVQIGANEHTIRKAVVPAFAAGLALGAGGAGTVAGAYIGYITYFGLGWESTPSATLTVTVTGAAEQIVFTAPAAFDASLTGGDAPVIGVRCYLTQPAGAVTTATLVGTIYTAGGTLTLTGALITTNQLIGITAPKIHGLAIGFVAPEPLRVYPVTGATGTSINIDLNAARRLANVT